MDRGHVMPGTFSDVQVGEAGDPLHTGVRLPGLRVGARSGGGWGGEGEQGQAPDAGGVAGRRWGL